MSVTVIIPAYNAEKYVGQAIESVLAQTLAPDEILLIDDGSTDRTAQVGASFGPSVQVISRENGGVSAARNLGVHLAGSEWIAFLDADDLWAPNKLELQMKQLDLHPEADLCYTGRISFREESGQVVFRNRRPGPPVGKIWNALLQDTTFLPSSVVIRRSTFIDSGGFAQRLAIVQDWDLWLTLIDMGIGFAACPDLLHIYRLHDANLTGDRMKMWAEHRMVFETRVLPRLSGPRRWLTMARFYSDDTSETSYQLRRRNDSRCVLTMAKSLLLWPFGTVQRYKVLAHMIYSTLRASSTWIRRHKDDGSAIDLR